MAGSWSARHGEQIRSTPSGRTDNNYFQVVDTPGFGNSLEEEEVSSEKSDAVVDLELSSIPGPDLISAGLAADVSHQVWLQQEAHQSGVSPVFWDLKV